MIKFKQAVDLLKNFTGENEKWKMKKKSKIISTASSKSVTATLNVIREKCKLNQNPIKMEPANIC